MGKVKFGLASMVLICVVPELCGVMGLELPPLLAVELAMGGVLEELPNTPNGGMLVAELVNGTATPLVYSSSPRLLGWCDVKMVVPFSFNCAVAVSLNVLVMMLPSACCSVTSKASFKGSPYLTASGCSRGKYSCVVGWMYLMRFCS